MQPNSASELAGRLKRIVKLPRFVFSKILIYAILISLFASLVTSTGFSSVESHAITIISPQATSTHSPGTSSEWTLHVEGHNIVDRQNDIVNLNGLNYGDYPNDVYPNRFNTGNLTLDALNIKAAGFNVVNLVEEWGYLETSSSTSIFSYDNSAWNLMQSRITSLTSQGIYVIVKLHADSEQWPMYNHLMSFLGSSQYCAAQGDFLTAMGDNFYSISASQNANSGIAHLTKLWLRISNLTINNPLVIGFDLLNEPWYCSNTQLSQEQIHDYWYSRISEMTVAIRGNHHDNRIVFVEEAPNYDGYVYFRPYPDNNTVSSIHWYRGAYQSGNGYYVACTGDYKNLYDYWSNITQTSNNACSGQDPQWILQAHLKYPNQAFMIGEFGNIYSNQVGDVSDQWITSSIHLFQDQGITSWIYWSSGDDGSWVKDIQSFQKTISSNSLDTSVSVQTTATVLQSEIPFNKLIRILDAHVMLPWERFPLLI